jgi:hypothetical protein
MDFFSTLLEILGPIVIRLPERTSMRYAMENSRFRGRIDDLGAFCHGTDGRPW